MGGVGRVYHLMISHVLKIVLGYSSVEGNWEIDWDIRINGKSGTMWVSSGMQFMGFHLNRPCDDLIKTTHPLQSPEILFMEEK